ncbi:MAG TPA: hypothetical protein VK934_09670 [Fimbriimonas sp.]|nr:hypothetical protein [Fimbriimonas sp.]
MKAIARILLYSGGFASFLGFPMYFVLSPRDSSFVWALATAMCWGGPVIALFGATLFYSGESESGDGSLSL